MKEHSFRPCVVGVFINTKKQILVGKRKDSHAWQCPQGGVDEGESFLQALHREMQEEVGISEFEILQATQGLLHYEFPKDLNIPIAKNFIGQAQKWYLCRLTTAQPSLDLASDDEFIALDWMEPEEVLQSIIAWKKPVYLEAFKILKLI